jgi:hypothetical protein
LEREAQRYKEQIFTNLYCTANIFTFCEDLNLDQKDGFCYNLFIVFEASYYMYNIETGWNLGSLSSMFITDPVAKRQLCYVIDKYSFEHLIDVKTMDEVVSQIKASGA